MKKLLIPIVTILLALICMVPASALAGHIISVDPDIDCDGYKVTVWAYVHAGYTVTMDATLSNDVGYFSELHHSKTFNKKKRTVKAVFAGSWDDVLCEYYDFSGTVTLKNQCGDQVDSENGQATLSCNCNQCTSDEDCDDNDLCNGIETCVNNQCVSEIPDSECGACEGKVTQLTLRYSGEIPDYIDVVQKDLQHVFQGTVQPGGTFTFNGGYSDGTLGNEISIFVDDDPFKTTKFHTSCSVPIGPGLVKGDFEVVEGYSRYGGLLCPLFPTLYCDDGNSCTNDWCDPLSGCQHVNNTAPCDDGNGCTEYDVCAGGSCQGDPVICDDGDDCTSNSCDTATGCVFSPILNCECDEDRDCRDDDLCNGIETCVNYLCVAGAPPDCDDGNPCTDDNCDPTGGCRHIDNQEPCDDGNVCTENDYCANGVCRTGELINCDDGDDCTVDTCNPVTECVYTPVPDCECNEDSDCTDNDVCTGTEKCVGNTCTEGTTLTCNDGNPCTDDSCDRVGGCQYDHNNSACDDSSVCTEGDYCAGGSCQPGNQITCDDDNACTVDTCNPLTGCMFTPVAGCECDEDSDCSDNDVCTGQETCDLQTKKCVGGTPLSCGDGNPCTDDWCDTVGGCQHAFNSLPCDDGNVCTENDYCAGGSCRPGTPISCDDGDGCTNNTCDPTTGCQYPPVPGCACDEDSDCIDDNICNGVESCNLETNQCVAGTTLDCNDGNVCTDDSCITSSGCVYENNNSACDDGNVCTDGDSCAGGSCQPGIPITCDDGDGCTENGCNPLTGCVFSTVPGCECDEDTDCIDSDVCNGVESCLGNQCTDGTQLNCDDGNVCTDDSCDAVGGCQYVNNGNTCNDNNACTESDVCVGKNCQGTLITCDDGDGCTVDICNSLTGCVYTPIDGCECDEDNDCSDNDVCTGHEICDLLNGTCRSGAPLTCDDGNECTDDSCDEEGGCEYANNLDNCNDENRCTAGDNCSDGNCGGTPIVCDDGDGCTVNTCNPLTGCVYTSIDGCECDEDSDCSDMDVCTGAETCVNSKCVAGTYLTCDDGNVCTDDSCDKVGGCQYLTNTDNCNDENRCTAGDNCSDGNCGGTPIVCDDGDGCTGDTCNPLTGCVFTPISGCQCDEDSDCSDDDVCNGEEICNVQTGKCMSGTLIDCDDGNECTDDWCDGGCQHADNTDACDDENKCTAGDSCNGGSCGGLPISCDDGDGCTTDTCNPLTGCVFTTVPGCQCDEDADCIDADVCNGEERCEGNTCAGGTAPDCDDGNACTDDWCDGGCQHADNTDACDDENKCTAGDSCNGGACGGSPISCDDGDGCTTDTCNPLTGCVYPPIPGCQCDEDADCIDTDVCNGEERCEGNTCVGGTAPDCDDGNGCTDDWCDGGCQHTNNTDACDDQSKCTESDTCANGICEGTPIACSDGDDCTTDNCNPLTGCVYTPVPGCQCDEDVDCIDADVCNGEERCEGNTCVGGTWLDCDDGNECTDDWCDGGCMNADNTSACDDESKCTESDTCANGICVGTPITCNDGDGCTTDTCNPLTGCEYPFIPGCECDEDSDCEDDDVCTGQETCNLQTGTCVAGTTLDCIDDNVCTDDSCDPVDGCQYAINTSPCDDGNACTAGDTCSVGACQGTPISCDDGNNCTSDGCNPGSGCTYTNNTFPCDDDIFCNGDDTCSDGNCSDHQGDPCPPDHTCNEGADTCDPPLPCVLILIPPSALLNPGETAQFTPVETGPCNTPAYVWTDTLACGDVDANGLFTAYSGEGFASSSFLVDDLPETGEVCVTDHANGGISACSTVTVVETGSVECDLLIYEGETPGRRNIPVQCDETIELCACSDCPDPCLEWYIDPPSTIGSTIITHPDGTATYTAGCDCNKLVEETIVVVDACNGVESDSITVTVGTIELEVLDVYSRPGFAGVEVDVSLNNPGNSIKAMQLNVVDECDMLTCTECVPDSDRAIEFVCSANEQPDGSCKVVVYATDPSALITHGAGPLFRVLYNVHDDVPNTVCCGIYLEDISAADMFQEPLSVCTLDGQMCFITCGDIYPQDCLGGDCGGDPFCGDGAVNLFDILEAIDIILGLTEYTDCQFVRGDVPNGMPPYCGNPAGTPNCMADGDIDIFDVLVIIDRALGRANCCDYCYFGEIF